MLPLPADPRHCGQRFFHHRRGVDEYFQRRAVFAVHPAAEALEFLLHHIMVIAPPGINRNIGGGFIFKVRQRVTVGAVIHPQHDNALRILPQGVWRLALICPCRQPIHVAVPSQREEFPEARDGGLAGAGRGKADGIKAQRLCLFLDNRLQIGQKSSFS